jgi:large subunit ribosomal protein L32
VPCSQCGQLMRAHHVCKSCGTYRGRQVIEMGDQAENE